MGGTRQASRCDSDGSSQILLLCRKRQRPSRATNNDAIRRGPAAHPGSPWCQLPFCRLIHQNACSDRAVAPRTAENAPGGKTPKQTLTGELISIYQKWKNSRTRGVSEWISICFELSSGNSNQKAENPGPRNVSECLDLFRIPSGNSSQNA